MELRHGLTPEPIPPDLMSTLSGHANAIASLMESGRSWSEHLARFNAIVGYDVDPTEFGGIHASEDPQDFIRHVLNRPARVPDITRNELIEIVDRLSVGDADSDFYLELFEANVSHPQAGDLIYWPPEELRDASSAQIVDAALSYVPGRDSTK